MVNCSKLLKLYYLPTIQIYIFRKKSKFVFDTLNKELYNLSVWFKINTLSLNVKKTNYIVFGRKNITNNDSELFIDNNVITKVHSSKFLGITIDEKLKWQEYINAVANKVSNSLGEIYKMKNALPVSILPMLYSTLILLYYQYCNMVWACNYPSKLHKLSVLQKRVIRINSAAEFRTHAADLFKRHRQLTLVDINKLQIAIFVFKSLTNLLPSVFMDYFKCNSELHRHTRSANNLHIIRYNINTLFFYKSSGTNCMEWFGFQIA